MTYEFLESVYPCFIKHANKWRYDMLTQVYWDNLLSMAVLTGSIDHILENHPDKNPYCWFI